MELQREEIPSEGMSSLFGAPTEQMAACWTSNPSLVSCPKDELDKEIKLCNVAAGVTSTRVTPQTLTTGMEMDSNKTLNKTMESQTNEQTSLIMSSSFGAPTEGLVACDLSSNPSSSICPKIEMNTQKESTGMDKANFSSCHEIRNFPLLSECDEVRYWKHRLAHAKEMPDCLAFTNQALNAHELIFDYAEEVLIAECVKKMKNREITPASKPARLRPDRWGNVPWYATFYAGKFVKASPDSKYVAVYASDYKDEFTLGMYEAAGRITKHIWKPRTVRCSKDKGMTVRFYICYRFLRDHADVRRGNDKNVLKVPPGRDTQEYVELTTIARIAQENNVREDALMRQIAECKPHKELTWVEPYKRYDEVENAAYAMEARVEEVPNSMMPMKVSVAPFIPSPYENIPATRQYPYTFLWDDVKDYDPQYNPFGKLRRTYFTEIDEIYRRIGRWDLAVKSYGAIHNVHPASSLRRNWRMEKDEWHLRQAGFSQKQTDFVAQGGCFTGAMSVDEVPRAATCMDAQRRSRILRILNQQEPLLARHLDKMVTMCNRPEKDLLSFERQKRIICTMPERDFRATMEYLAHVHVDIPNFPAYYVIQARLAKRLLMRAMVNPTDMNIKIICGFLIAMINFWHDHEFEAWRCQCVAMPDVSDWRAQSNEQPPLKAAGGPNPGTAKDGVTAASTMQTPIVDGKKTVTMTMVDQRDEESATVSGEKSARMPKAVMPERLYHLEEIAKRPMLIDRFLWSTSNDLGDILQAWLMPHAYFSARDKKPTVCQNLNAAYVLSMYGNVRFDMKFEFKINSTKFQQGILKAVWKPFMDMTRNSEVFDNQTVFPSCDIRANESNPVILTIPWNHFRDAFPTYTDPNQEYNYLGGLGVVVWNKLRTGDNGSKDANISLWMSLENLKVTQLCNPKGPGQIRFASAILGQTENGAKTDLTQPEKRIAKMELWEAQAALEGVMAAMASEGVGILKETGADLMEKFLNKVSPGANSKPTMPAPPLPVYPQAMENLSHGEGAEIGSRMDLYPIGVSLPSHEREHDMNLTEMSRKWCRIATGTWTTDDAENKVLFSCPVTPSIQSGEDSQNMHMSVSYMVYGEGGTECYLIRNSAKQFKFWKRNGCMLDFLSTLFFYWRGPIEYKIEVVCTSMHTGRVIVRYEPFGNSQSAIMECQKAATPGILWDVEEKHELIFEAPFASVQEWLQCQYKSDGSVSDHVMTKAFSGIWEIVVNNKLKGTAGVAQEVDVNVYCRAGKGFRFYKLCPLDGVMGLRDNIGGGDDEVQDTRGKRLIEVLGKFLNYPLRNKSTGTKTETVNGYETTYSTGGGWADWCDPTLRKSHSVWVQWMNKVWKEILAEENDLEIWIPSFSTHDEAHQWVADFDEKPYFITETMDEVYKKDWTNWHRQVLTWWYAYALMKEKAWLITTAPPIPKEFGYSNKISEKKKEWVAQAKSEAINPFLSEESVEPTYNTEDWMDMYKILRRPVLWSTQTVPRTMGNNDVDNIYKRMYREKEVECMARMTPWERANAWFEFRIPVTPMLHRHQVGEKGHWFTDRNAQGTERERSRHFGNIDANSDGGSMMCMTPMRYLAETFTFWYGEMRYRFIFHNMTRKADKEPWQIFIMHHPGQFASFDTEDQNYRLVPMSRVREMSQLGTVMYAGNIQSQIPITVPWASMFRKLYLTSAYRKQFTDNGCILVYIPFCSDSPPQCGKTISTDKFTIEGVTFSVAVSISEGFRFEGLRAPPQVIMWDNYYYRNVNNNHQDWGWATSFYKNMNKNRLEVYDPDSVVRMIKAQDGEEETEKVPVLSAVKRINITNGGSMSTDSKEVGTLAKLQIGLGKDNWVAQGKDQPEVTPGSSDVKQVDIFERLKSRSPEEIEDMLKSPDEVDFSIGAIFKESATAISDFREVMSNIKTTAEGLTNVTSSVEEAATTVAQTASKFGTFTKWSFNAARMAIFFNGLSQLLTAKEWSDRYMPIAQCAMALGISVDVVTSAGQWLMQWFTSATPACESTKANETEAQGFESIWNNDWSVFLTENGSMLRLIAAAVLTLLTFYMTSSAPMTGKVTQFSGNMYSKLKNLAVVGTAIKTLDWLFKWLAMVIKEAAQMVGNWATDGKLVEYRMSAYYPEIIEWLRCVAKFETDELVSHLAWDSDARFELWKKMDEGEEFLEKLSMKTGPMYNSIMRGMAILNKAHAKMLMSREIPHYRYDPFHISLVGEPGVGKSAVMTHIMDFIADEMGLPQKHRYYARNADDQFWTNYAGQPIVLIDDFMQQKDAPLNKEIIAIKSNMPLPLNMADINEKGRGFSSVLMGSTTNVAFPTTDKLVSNQAIWRRRNILAEVTSVGVGENKIKPENLRFRILVANPGPIGTKITEREGLKIDEFMTHCLQEYMKYDVDQKALVFANLRGRTVTIPMEQEVAEIKLTQTQEIISIINQLGLDAETINKLIEHLDDNELDEVVRCAPHEIYRCPKVQAWIAKKVIVDIPGAPTYEELKNLKTYEEELKLAVNDNDTRRLKRCILFDRSLAKERIKWEKIAGGYKTILSDNSEIVVPTEALQIWKAQMFEEVWADGQAIEERRQEMRQARLGRARDHLARFDLLKQGMSGILQSQVERLPSRTIKVIDAKELDNYCTNYLKHMNEEQKEMVKKSAANVFKYINDKTTASIPDVMNSRFSMLFETKFRDLWKKNDKDEWVMCFDDKDWTEETIELESLYVLMKDTWSKKEIKDALEVTPVSKKGEDSAYLNRLAQYAQKKSQEWKKWFQEHPKITMGLQLAAALGGIFIGYKIIGKLFPSAVDALTGAFASMFCWITGTSMKDKLEDAKSLVKGTVGTVKQKVSDYYDMARKFLSSNPDPDVRNLAEDEQAIQLVAESFVKRSDETARSLLISKAIAEGRKVKTYNANPYVLADLTPMHVEGQLSEQTVTKLPVVVKKNEWVTNGTLDKQSVNLRETVLARNMCCVKVIGAFGTMSMRGLFLKGRTLMVPRHFFAKVQENDIMSIKVGKGIEFIQKFNSECMVEIPGKDIALYECSPRVGTFGDITHHFITTSDLDRVNKIRTSLNTYTEGGVIYVQFGDAEITGELEYRLDGEPIKCNQVWQYEMETEYGICGSVLMACNPNVQRKFLGIHVAGTTGSNHGASAVITQEILKQEIARLPTTITIKNLEFQPHSLITQPLTEMKVVPEGNFELIGAVSPEKAVRLPHKSEIIPSPIQGLVREPVTEPSVLTKNDVRNESGESPLIKAVSKYGKKTIPYNHHHRRLVKQDMMYEVLSWNQVMEARLMTDHEAVWGNDLIEYCERMNMKASPGYPWTLSRPAGEMGKAYLFDINASDGIACEKYRYEYGAREKLGRSGIRKVSIWTDCLKDERRSIEKIKLGKTRAFMLPPADYVQLFRKYFMAFSVNFYANNCKSFSAVGMDPYSYAWTRLSNRMRKRAKFFFGGDFHNFDGTLDPEIVWDILEIVEEWYKRNDPNWCEEDQMMRQVLWHEIIHTVHICLNSIYMTHQGNPSGNPFTVILNTLYHAIVIRLVFMEIMIKQDLMYWADMYWFHKFVIAIYYGDDGLQGVAKSIKDIFNLQSVQEQFKTHGIDYTAEDKNSVYTTRPLEECTFLKNGFDKLKGTLLWLAPIALDTIYELTNWIHRSDDPIAQLRENIQTALRFAFHHGKEFYERFGELCAEACLKMKIRSVPFSYALALEEFQVRCAN